MFKSIFLAVFLPLLALADSVSIELTDGAILQVESLALKNSTISFTVNGEAKELSIEKVQKVTLSKDLATITNGFQEVALVDGSRFKAKNLRFEKTKLTLELVGESNFSKASAYNGADIPQESELTVDLDKVHFILKNAHLDQNRNNLKRILESKTAFDRVLTLTAEGLQSFEGTVSNLDSQAGTYDIQTASGSSDKLRINRSAGFIFAKRPAAVNLEIKKASWVDRFGNEFALKEFELQASDVKAQSVSGYKIAASLKNASAIDFSNGLLTSLATLKTTASGDFVEDTSFISAFSVNENFDGNAITLWVTDKNKRVFNRGITIHSGVTLSFVLDKKFSGFKTFVGVEALASSKSVGELTLFADDTELAKVPFESDKPAVVIDTVLMKKDLSEVKTLTLEVKSTGKINIGDQVSLGNPILIK